MSTTFLSRSFDRRVSDHQHDGPAVVLHADGLARAAKSRADAWTRFRNPAALRDAAAAIRAGDIRRLDSLLEDFCSRFEKAGGHVHWAAEAAEAREALAGVITSTGVKKALRGRSTTLAEIGADAVFAQAKLPVQHTEFGEMMNHYSGDLPSHPVYTASHHSRAGLAQMFHDKAGEPVARSAEELADLVRRRLRPAFMEADCAVMGANFLLADSGHVALAEDEGNLRLGVALPRILIIVAGIDKVTAGAEGLPVLLAALAAAASGRTMMPSVTLFRPDASRGCGVGAREVHLVLVDNGRTARLANPAKSETLRCIGCGACADACPVYKLGGGKSFGLRAPGPFGLATELGAHDAHARRTLALATPLCGACGEACPVGIDLPGALAATRAEPGTVIPGRRLRLLLKLYLWSVRSPGRFAWGVRFFKAALVATDLVRDTALNPIAGWSRTRTLPDAPDRSFRSWWKETGGAASPAARKD